MNKTRWNALSRIPGTEEHRVYEAVTDWLVRVDEWLDKSGMVERSDRLSSVEIPRDPDSLRFVMESTAALIRSIAALHRGVSVDESRAILNEHLPPPPPIEF